jgi:hypothetical protein
MIGVPLVASTGAQTMVIALGDTRYRFRFFYSRRTDSWYFHLEITDGTRLLSGARLSGSSFPFRQYRNTNALMPDGELGVVDFDLAFGRPGRDDIGVGERHRLIFFLDADGELSEPIV